MMLPENDDTFLSRWLDGRLGEGELASFEQSEMGKQFQELMEASKMLRPTPYDADAAYARLRAKLPQKVKAEPAVKARKISPYMAYAAAAVVITAVASFFFFFYETSLNARVGEQISVELPDGSMVELHSNSSLSYHKWNFNKNREVSLKGEAFFSVQTGDGFEVTTPNGAVSVLGTSFNVKTRKEKLEVSCYTGKVKVKSGTFNVTLTPGDAIQVMDGTKTKSWIVPTDVMPEWQSGKTQFDQVSFEEVVEEIEALYGVQVINTASYNGVKYTGAIPHNNVEAALKLVFEPLSIPYTYQRSENEVRILTSP